MNGDYGQGLEQGKIADAFPGLAAQTASGDSWADRLVDHLTTPRAATEPPPPPAPPGMPPEAYDDMKINQLTVRQVANVVANEDRNVTHGASSAEDFYQSKLWKAHAVINGDRTFGEIAVDDGHNPNSQRCHSEEPAHVPAESGDEVRCRDSGEVHRTPKPENLLFLSASEL